MGNGSLQPGQSIDHFTLVKPLGEDPCGTVWLATESITNRSVSIKILAPDRADDAAIAALEQEIARLASLGHPSLISYAGRGFYMGLPYLAWEHMDGPSLAVLLSQGGRMDEYPALRIALQVAEGLEHAYQHGQLLHRDLHPGKIIIDPQSVAQGEPRIKVLDLGLTVPGQDPVMSTPLPSASGRLVRPGSRQSGTGRVMRRRAGSVPEFMAPEAFLSDQVEPGADMYSLGVIMFALLTGQPPFSGDFAALQAAHARAIPKDLHRIVPGLSLSSGQVVQRLLAKQPAGRYKDWSLCVTALRQAADRVRQRQADAPGTRRHSATSGVGTASPMGPEYVPTLANSGTGGFGTGVSGVSVPGPIPANAAIHQSNLDTGLPPVPAQLQQQSALAGILSEHIGIDDGLTAAQRAAVWSFFFRQAAVLSGVATTSVEPVPMPGMGQSPGPSPVPISPPVVEMPGRIQVASEEPAVRSLGGPRDLTDIDGPDEAGRETTALQPKSSPNQSGPRQSMGACVYEKSVLKYLRQAILGSCRTVPVAPVSATKRLTTRLLRMVSRPEASLDAIDQLITGNRLREAEEMVDSMAELAGNTSDLSLRRARLAALQENWIQAQRWAQSATNQGCVQPQALAITGLCRLAERQYAVAEVLFKNLSLERPHSPMGHVGVAAVALLTNRSELAVTPLDEASQLTNGNTEVYALAAICCRLAKDAAAEMENWRHVLAQDPDDKEASQRLNELHAANNT